MKHNRLKPLAWRRGLTAAGLGAGAAIAACGTTARHPARTAASAMRTRPSGRGGVFLLLLPVDDGPLLSRGSMMGGNGYGWMMSPAGYRWMTGVDGVPGWMRRNDFPASMMGTARWAPAPTWGSSWAACGPTPRGPGSPRHAARLSDQVPTGAHLNRAARTITFTTSSVQLVVVAGPAGGRDETFRIAGMVNPAIAVPAGARVSIQVINADPDTAHGLVISQCCGPDLMDADDDRRPAFPGSALWFLGNPTAAGDARRDAGFHRQHPRHLPLPVPCARARQGRHDGAVHRHRYQLSHPAERGYQGNLRTGAAALDRCHEPLPLDDRHHVPRRRSPGAGDPRAPVVQTVAVVAAAGLSAGRSLPRVATGTRVSSWTPPR